MGAVATAPGAIVSAATSGACCASRASPVHCRNQRLKSRLAEMDANSQTFEEVWFFRDNPFGPLGSFAGLGPAPGAPERRPSAPCLDEPQPVAPPAPEDADPHHAIVYMYDMQGLRPLRLDWHSDGLCYADGGQDSGAWVNLAMSGRAPSDEVRLKVFKTPVYARQLLSYLKRFEGRVYDHKEFNSRHFCEALFVLEEGLEY